MCPWNRRQSKACLHIDLDATEKFRLVSTLLTFRRARLRIRAINDVASQAKRSALTAAVPEHLAQIIIVRRVLTNKGFNPCQCTWYARKEMITVVVYSIGF